MADTITSAKSLVMLAKYQDGDTRTISKNDPKTSIDLGAAVHDLETYCKANQPIIGDKSGAAFTGFDYAKIVTRNTIKFDLTP